ncbi:MAG: hypothetical protein HUU50_21310 [Candidatus Brocadiae bacterium]|nr:hypothetical protein [Candidatus Brocadiia bacterium]
MSSYYRTTPALGVTTAESEKLEKSLANRKERRLVRQILACSSEDAVLPLKREISDVWNMEKDGKIWFDAKENPKFMRK